MPGLKTNLDDFTEVLMQKLFKKREPTNEFKYILKKDTTHQRNDHSKPPYLDDLKRFGKLKEVGDRKKLNLIEHMASDIKRDFQDINIFNVELEDDFLDPAKLDRSIKRTQKKLKVQHKEKEKNNFSGAWYLPVSKWGKIKKNKFDEKNVFDH